MDYKYIEQLLERYFQCDTTLQEEAILRAFFQQEGVPERLMPYRDLFVCQQQEALTAPLGDDFDERLLAIVGEEAQQKKAHVVKLGNRLMPLFRAAAIVAIVLTIGNAAQFSLSPRHQNDDINYSEYTDTYNDPTMAYDQVEGALQLMSEGLIQSQHADTLTAGMRNNADSLVRN
jgi:hypothetical protein